MYLDVLRGSAGTIDTNKAQDFNSRKAFVGSGAFQQLLSRADYSKLEGADSINFAKQVSAAAAQTGVSTKEVLDVLRYSGADIGMAGAIDAGVNSSAALSEYANTIRPLLKGGADSDTTIDWTSGAAASALSKYLSGDVVGGRTELKRLGVSAQAMDSIKANYAALSPEAKKNITTKAAALGSNLSRDNVNRYLDTAFSYAESVVGSAAASGVSGAAGAKSDLEGLRGNKVELLDALFSGTSNVGRVLADRDPIFKKIASIGDLTNTSAADIAMKFSGLVSEDEIKRMRQSGASNDDIKRALGLKMLDAGTLERAGVTSESAKAEALLAEASMYLKEVANRLGIKK
jgi:hypothetical protein